MRTASLLLCFCFARALHADAAKPTFADDVQPLLKQSCVSCHNDDKQRGGLNLLTFATTMEGGSSGAVVVPGQPDKSRLYTLPAHSAEPKMPPMADKIAAANLDILKKWIEQGARENVNSKAAVAVKPATNSALPVAARGKPATPPMPGTLPREPIVTARRPGTVTALAASPWAPLVALGGTKQIVLFHSDMAELLGILPFPHGQVNDLKFSRNGKLLLAAGGRGGASGKAVLFDIATGKSVIEVGQETDAILAADVSADQSQIAAGSPSKIVRVYSTADGSLIREIKKHTDWVTAIEYSPDGVLLASGDRNGGIFIWEAATGREFFALRGPTAAITGISWRDDANAVAVSSEDGTIRIFEMDNGTQIKNWPAHGGGVSAVKFSHDNRLVSTGRDRVTKLWDANGVLQKQFEALPDLGMRAVITSDGSRVVAGDWSGLVRVWTTADAKLQANLDANPPAAEERARRAEKAFADAEAKLKLADDALAAAKAAAGKAGDELAGLQKTVADATAAHQAAAPAVAPAKAELDKQTAAVAAAQTVEVVKTQAHKDLEDAAKKLFDTAAKLPNDVELKAQSAKVTAIAKEAQALAETARKVTVAVQAAQKSANEKWDAAQKKAQAAAATLTAAQQQLQAGQAARQPALDALPRAQAVRDLAKAEFDRAKRLRDIEKPAAKK